jgi:glycerophosphoryl diester phosphodiesterase
MYICALFNAIMRTQDIYKKFFLDNTVVAHMGAWKTKGAPQNSIESLREAMRLGCAGTEFDVHMTADNVFILYHDNTYYGKLIEKHTYAELAKIKLPNGEAVPTLEKTLMEGMKQTDTRLFVEIKPSSTVERTLISAEKIVKTVNEAGAQPWVFYISYDYEAVRRIKQLVPSSMVAYLSDDVSPEQLKHDNISLNVRMLKSSEDVDLFLSHNVDYLTTDEPELLLSKRKITIKKR